MGGVYSNVANVNIYNSTIAFNTAGKFKSGTSPTSQFFAPGLTLSGEAVAVSVVLQSSLMANNVYGAGNEWDLSTPYTGTNAVSFNTAPANNLIRTAFPNNLPSDTISFDCPLLGQLRNNGGATKTHALLSHSPGIDMGNNAVTASSNPFVNSFKWDEDQRGLGDVAVVYPRQSPLVADIGAYEINQADVIFNNDFETCPELF